MISHKRAVHATNLELEGPFQKRSSNKVIESSNNIKLSFLLSFIGRVKAFQFVNCVPEVLVIMREIITIGASCPGLDLKQEAFPVLLRTAIDLRTQADLIVHTHKSMVIFQRLKIVQSNFFTLRSAGGFSSANR
jgi:hypothetical protein